MFSNKFLSNTFYKFKNSLLTFESEFLSNITHTYLGCSHRPAWQFNLYKYYWRSKRPRAPYTKPLSFDYSGDLKDHVIQLDLNQPKLGFEDLEEYNSLDETLKKIYSLEFSKHNEVMEKIIEEVVKQVQDHALDVKTIEIEIAKVTVQIRNQIKHCVRFRHDGISIAVLRNRITRRNDWLGHLKEIDIEKFKWLISQLGLVYKPKTKYEEFSKLSKRATRKKIARDAAIALVKEKSAQLQKNLKTEYERFKKYREQELDKIEQDLKQLGIDKMESIEETLKLLGHEEMMPKKKKLIYRREDLIFMNKLKLLGPQKIVEDDRLLTLHGFLTPSEFSEMPDKPDF